METHFVVVIDVVVFIIIVVIVIIIIFSDAGRANAAGGERAVDDARAGTEYQPVSVWRWGKGVCARSAGLLNGVDVIGSEEMGAVS